MIGIIAAMDLEIQPLLEAMKKTEVFHFADKTFYKGLLAGTKTVLAKSGIGKVNAAITTTLLLANFEIDRVVNTGVAGGIEPARVGDIVLAEGVAYFDVSLDIDDIPYGKMANDPLIVAADPAMIADAKEVFLSLDDGFVAGNVVSGDAFVTSLATLERIRESVPNVLAAEMEGMAVAMTCHKFQVPFLSIRGISDVIGHPEQSSIYSNAVEAIARKTSGFVLAFVGKS